MTRQTKRITLRRFLAFGLDWFVIAIWAGILLGFTMLIYSGKPPSPSGPWIAQLISFLAMTLPIVVYFSICEAGSWRATLGKRMMRLRVAGLESDPDSLSKNSFQWNQEERELGFLHYDEVFEGRDVPPGEKVQELPKGKPIIGLNEDVQTKREFEEFLKEQKVAGLLILHDGMVRKEHYALGLTETGRCTSLSVAKSVTSTLAGIAIKEGHISSVDDYVTNYIPDLAGSAYENVTVQHLLTMSFGVRWNEVFTNGTSDNFRLFRDPIDPGIDHTVSYMRRLPAEAEPGKIWLYKTGETHLLGDLVSSATGQTLSGYLSSKIWAPYGMEQKATWILNQTGQELAGCCLQMKLRDLARFGQFILEGGIINGESIVPDDWFKTATQTQFSVWGGLGYGYQWWTYADGTFQALGAHGQMIHIDPERSLVIAINSPWPEAESNTRRVAVSNFVKTIANEIDEEKIKSNNP